MTVSLKHKFTSAIPDGADATIVRPSNWNDEHALIGTANKILGFDNTGAGSEITVGSGLLLSAGTLTATGGGTGTVTSVDVSGGSTGLTFSGGPVTTSGTITAAGTLAIGSGGTGQATASAAFNALSPITTAGDLILGNGANSATRLGIGANTYVLTSNGTTAAWAAIPASGVTSFSAGTTGFTPSTGTTGAVTLAGTLVVSNGGTGAATLTGYVYGNGTSAMTASTTIPGSAITGNISGNAANVTGTVAIGNGGTGQTTALAGFNALSPMTTAGDLILGGVSGSATRLGIGANTYVLTSNGTTASWAAAAASGVSSFSAGTTGFTPSTGTTGAVTLAGTLATANGGTNLTTFTAANNAIYSTSASVLTAGTLPIAAGGTGQTTASAAFNALSPITSTGDLIIGNGTNSATRLANGATNTVLVAGASTASWVTAAPQATNLAGGVAGSVPYQSASATTLFSAAGTTGQALLSGGTGSPTWGTLGTANGGTNLTTFTAANNAIYSTSASVLTAGTLPIAAGGTGSTTQNFVDITTTQATIAGTKTFTGQLIGKGTATNDSAAAGYIGEYISSQVLVGSAVTLTTATAANVTSISLTAGDWDVEGTVALDYSASPAVSYFLAWISTTSATNPTVPNSGAYYCDGGAGAYNAVGKVTPVGRTRISLSGTTTVYLSVQETFTGTIKAYGFIGARRAR
jgi:hypothetical protein